MTNVDAGVRGYENMPLPFGWFAVAMSDEIAPGQVKPLSYFGTEFVIWRGQDGELHALDAYCPHLGAHLGYGGEVIDNELRCPFHHWRFNGEGGVTDIPYSRMVPPKLRRNCQPSWPVQETGGVIFVWRHPKRAAPKWELSGPPEGTDGWIEAERHEWIIKIHVQEITENGQDNAHFNAVHGTKGPPASSEFKMDGWQRRTSVEATMMTPRGPMQGRITNMAVGPGQSFSLFNDVTDVLLAQQNTPIDSGTTHLRWQLFHPPGISEGKMRVTVARMRDLVKQLNQDIPIWEHKRFHPTPTLVEGDGPILAYRQQYARFYQFDDAPESAVA